jgi:hypothetical protein
VIPDGDRSIWVFSKEGLYLRSFGAEFSGIHSLSVREENGTAVLYGAHLRDQRVVKLSFDGKLLL